jgi:hypothetical protein
MNKVLKSCSSKKDKLDAIRKADKTLTANPSETLEELINAHFKSDPSGNTSNQIINRDIDHSIIEKIYNPCRLKEAVMSLDPHKSAGPDNIKPILIQKAWLYIKDVARDIMINSHILHHIPKPLQEVRGVFLPKPGKVDYCNTKSFRTICLSSVMLKLQEKVILWHMQHDLGMESCLSKKQFGFRKGTSTESALHKVIHTIERRMAKKGYVLGVFLDIEGAFDNISFTAIHEAIHKSPVDNSTANWIYGMITNRYINFDHKTASSRIKAERGCPQGGILSPFLCW